jgi:hypothetical protein
VVLVSTKLAVAGVVLLVVLVVANAAAAGLTCRESSLLKVDWLPAGTAFAGTTFVADAAPFPGGVFSGARCDVG